MASSVITNPIIGGGKWKLKSVTKETLTGSKTFSPSSDGNFIVLSKATNNSESVFVDGIEIDEMDFAHMLRATGYDNTYNMFSVQSFGNIRIENGSGSCNIYEYEPID